MNKSLVFVFLIIVGCGGNLSDEQRKKFKEGMEEQKIVRVTDQEIMTAALEKGKAVVKSLEGKDVPQSMIDSVKRVHNVEIHYTVPGASNALAIEQALIEAYIVGITENASQENLQKIYTSEKKDQYDSLLFSKPEITKFADGSEQLDGIWNIYMHKKNIVLDISKTK